MTSYGAVNVFHELRPGLMPRWSSLGVLIEHLDVEWREVICWSALWSRPAESNDLVTVLGSWSEAAMQASGLVSLPALRWRYEMMKIDDSVPAMMINGYHKDEMVRRFSDELRPPIFIQKPFKLETFARAIEDLVVQRVDGTTD